MKGDSPPRSGVAVSDGQQSRRGGPRVRERLDPVRAVLCLMVLAWSVIFIVLGSMRHNRFGTFGFDLGIYDQGIWLMSRLRVPFVTVRGIHFLGHHFNAVLVLLVPFYWLGAGPIFLLVVQVLAQASGAVAVYLLARDRMNGERGLAVALAGALLLNPTYQYLTWEFFHPDALAIAPLLFAYWAARERRWRWFAVSAGLALLCKEDVALALAIIGLLVAVRGNRRIGSAVTAVSAAWFFLATRVFIPTLNGIGPFYDSFFGDFGGSPGEIIRNIVLKPRQVWDMGTRADRTSYYWRMGAPFAFVFLAAPETMLVGIPMLAVNVLTSFPYARDPRFHYASLVLVGVTVGSVEGIARLGRSAGARRFLVGAVFSAAMVSSVMWGAAPWSDAYETGIWPLKTDARAAIKAEAVAMVPGGAATSAIYNLVPHLTHRDRIYEFPVPWCDVNWGVRGENLDDPAGVDWIAVDVNLLGKADRQLLDELVAREFTVRLDKEGMLVAERVAPPGAHPLTCLSGPSGG